MTSPAPTSENNAASGPFQFGLRALFLATACLSALFAVMTFIGPMWSTVLIWFLLLASLHVVANAWGTRGWRRDGESADDESELPGELYRLAGSRPHGVAPPTRLQESTRLGWTMLAATSAGATLAGGLGAGGLACLASDKVGWIALVVGGISAAVVGGFFGFLASSFLEVAGRAWREAVRGEEAVKREE